MVICVSILCVVRLSLARGRRQEVCRVSLSGDSELGSRRAFLLHGISRSTPFSCCWVLEFFAVRGMVLLLLTNISFSLSLWYVPYDQHETLTKRPEKVPDSRQLPPSIDATLIQLENTHVNAVIY